VHSHAWCLFALMTSSSAASVSVGGSKVYSLISVSLCSYDQIV
jgi:hypothetical protein